MTINIFEGSRRITKLAAALWVVGHIIGAFKQAFSSYGEGALYATGGLVFLWVFSWAVGWIVRGFMGIPKGHDRRPDAQ